MSKTDSDRLFNMVNDGGASDFVNPIERYASSYMLDIWSDKTRFAIYRDIEGYAFEKTLELKGKDSDLASLYWKKTFVDVKRIREIEATTQHELQSFVQMLTEQMGEKESRYIHYGLTSSDILDSGFAIQISKSIEYIEQSLQKLIDALKQKALDHKYTVMIGRSHGMYGEPITFGIKMARFFAEFTRQMNRLSRAKQEIAYISLSGPMGNYTNINPEVEKYVADKLLLKVEPISSQVIPRDRHAYVMSAIANLASSIENIAVELRLLQRSEVAEVYESFSLGQKGSSAMPHKKNPIKSENLTGLARIIRSSLIPSLENIALWHERDMSHSSVERLLFPQSLIITEFALNRLTSIVKSLEVDAEAMKKKLELSNGNYASHSKLLKMIDSGLSRNQAYKMIQDESFNGKLQTSSISVDDMLARTDYIFKRIFGK